MKTKLWTRLAAVLTLGAVAAAPAFAQTKEVTIGYQDMVVPYRIAQEAISNAARHSGASRVTIEWSVQAPRCAVLRVADDGKGFDASESRPGHFGLDNLRARAKEIGALLTITSGADQGSEVRLEVPLVAASAATT